MPVRLPLMPGHLLRSPALSRLVSAWVPTHCWGTLLTSFGVRTGACAAGATGGAGGGELAPSVSSDFVGVGSDATEGGLFHPRRYFGSLFRRTSEAASFCCAAMHPAVQSAPVDGGATLHDPGFGSCVARPVFGTSAVVTRQGAEPGIPGCRSACPC